MPYGNRRSIRLREYDYTREGYCFITICTYQRKEIFGTCDDDIVELNVWGEIIKEELRNTERLRRNIKIDSYIIMPNHIHIIISVGAHCMCPLHANDNKERFGRSTKNSIPTIVKLFKASVSKRIKQINPEQNEPVWQRNYYENIIRNEKQLNATREYIQNNPKNWVDDRENLCIMVTR